MPRTSAIAIALALIMALGLVGSASAETNPLIDLLKQKGIVTDEEAGRLERELDDYYQRKLAPGEPVAPATAVQPAAAEPPAGPAPVAEAATAPAPKEQPKRRNRVNWGGEARFRIMDEHANAPAGWGGERVTLSSTTGLLTGTANIRDVQEQDAISFPLRMRLNWDAEVVPGFIDVWGRFTINKRWGTFSDVPEQDPFNAPNSFAASIGSEIALRTEQIYMTMKPPEWAPGDLLFYIGRLPGLDGPPSRQDRSIFPRLFIDSEIDGALLQIGLPDLPTSQLCIPYGGCPINGNEEEKFRGGVVSQYKAKLKNRNALYLGYLDYNETKLSSPSGRNTVGAFLPVVGDGPSSDVVVGQLQIKLFKDTELILNGLWMNDWYMPRTDISDGGSLNVQAINPEFDPARNRWIPGIDIPFFTSDYLLYGGYFDTQLFGFQIYGSLYFNHLDVPPFAYQLLLPDAGSAIGTPQRSSAVEYEGNDFEGMIWHAGMNTGTWLAKWNLSYCAEFASGSDAWINPFNYRGYRRKGSVLFPQPNAYFGGNQVVGFYPFNANVLDTYLDYFWNKAKFRLGLMYFWHFDHDRAQISASGTDLEVTGGPGRILGWSRYERHWWPYFEINLVF